MWNLFFSSFKFRIHHLKKKKSHVWSLLSATALQEALLRAVKMPKKEREEGKPPQRSTDMISTLTDGMPNRGELPQFGRLVRLKCCVMFYWAPVPEVFMTVCAFAYVCEGVSLFCLGFRKDLDYLFLDVMSRQNKELARRIFLSSDAKLQVEQKKKTKTKNQLWFTAKMFMSSW